MIYTHPLLEQVYSNLVPVGYEIDFKNPNGLWRKQILPWDRGDRTPQVRGTSKAPCSEFSPNSHCTLDSIPHPHKSECPGCLDIGLEMGIDG